MRIAFTTNFPLKNPFLALQKGALQRNMFQKVAKTRHCLFLLPLFSLSLFHSSFSPSFSLNGPKTEEVQIEKLKVRFWICRRKNVWSGEGLSLSDPNLQRMHVVGDKVNDPHWTKLNCCLGKKFLCLVEARNVSVLFTPNKFQKRNNAINDRPRLRSATRMVGRV